jgi:hypothetical protein
VQFQRLVRLGPIREQHRYGRDHLHLYAELLVVGDTVVGIERVLPDFAEELAVLVDTVAALGLYHDREAVVAVFVGEIRPVRRQDVGVGVDFEHASILAGMARLRRARCNS